MFFLPDGKKKAPMDIVSTLRQGFAVIPDVFDALEVDRIADLLAGYESVGTRCLLDCPWCQETAGAIQERLNASIPELQSLCAVQCTFFNKTADANWFVAFHQDRSAPVSDDTLPTAKGWSRKEGMTFIQPPDSVMCRMLALRLHVDDCNSDNGPLRVLPGTHTEGTLSQERIEEYRDKTAPCELTVPAGGVIAMRPLLLHGSAESRTMTNRRVLHFLFAPRELPNGLKWRNAV
jgi:ectoine hydroxylase-related dioxygenase (phytanoyl-CoA dioxygenase family)